MSMWASAILGFLQSLPKLIEMAEKLVSSINQYAEQLRVQNELKKFDHAVEAARHKKDTSELDRLFNPRK